MSYTRAASMPLSSKLTMPRAPIRFMPLAINTMIPSAALPMVSFRFTLAANLRPPPNDGLPRVPFRFTGAAIMTMPTIEVLPHHSYSFKRAASFPVSPNLSLPRAPLSRMAIATVPPNVSMPCAYFTGDANSDMSPSPKLRPLSFHSRARNCVPPIRVLPCAYFKAGPQQHCRPLRPCPAPISKHGQFRSVPQLRNAMPLFQTPATTALTPDGSLPGLISNALPFPKSIPIGAMQCAPSTLGHGLTATRIPRA